MAPQRVKQATYTYIHDADLIHNMIILWDAPCLKRYITWWFANNILVPDDTSWDIGLKLNEQVCVRFSFNKCQVLNFGSETSQNALFSNLMQQQSEGWFWL